MTPIFTLNHVCLAVSDMRRSLRCYADALGGSLVKTISGRDGDALVCFLRLGEGLMLELFRKRSTPLSFVGHVAFQVASAEDARRHLLTHGIFCGPVILRPSGNLICIATDPDGHELEIIEHAPGMDPRMWSIQTDGPVTVAG